MTVLFPQPIYQNQMCKQTWDDKIYKPDGARTSICCQFILIVSIYIQNMTARYTSNEDIILKVIILKSDS